jgi:hypothetical protein
MSHKSLPLFLLLFITLAGCITVELGPEPIEVRLIQVALETPAGQAPTAVSLAPTETPMPSPTATATSTATPTVTPTYTEPPPTTAPAEFTARLALTANCRSGPAITFSTVTYVNAGEQVLVIARLADDSWFLAQLPDRQDPCWLAASVLDLDGASLVSLAIATSQPTPAPVVALFTATPTQRSGGGGSGSGGQPSAATSTPKPAATQEPYPGPEPTSQPTDPPYP